MRPVAGALLVLLLAAGCGGGETPPPRPVAPKVAPVTSASEPITIRKPGSRRALVYTWREKLPRELPSALEGEPAFLLREAEYVRTDDLGNAWSLTYCTKDGGRELRVAAIEYASPGLARERYDQAAAVPRGARPLAVPGCEAAVGGGVEADARRHGVAVVLSGRYLFSFDLPDAGEVAPGTVQGFVGACLAEPAPSGQ